MNVIVVGVDHSPGATEAVRFALEEAKLRDATLRAVHAWQFGYIGLTGLEGALPAAGGELREFRAAAAATLDATPAGGDSGEGRSGSRAARHRRRAGGRAGQGIAQRGPARRGLALARRVRPVASGLGWPTVRTPRRMPGGNRAAASQHRLVMDVRLKRAYEPAAASDGGRILVDRIWPRGVTREQAQLSEWARELCAEHGATPLVRTRSRPLRGVPPTLHRRAGSAGREAARAAPAGTRRPADTRLRSSRRSAQRCGCAR